jgi:hypothetical protein
MIIYSVQLKKIGVIMLGRIRIANCVQITWLRGPVIGFKSIAHRASMVKVGNSVF